MKYEHFGNFTNISVRFGDNFTFCWIKFNIESRYYIYIEFQITMKLQL